MLYNLYKPEGSRVMDLQVLCTKCRVPEYVPIEDSTSYQFIAPAFIVSGGDGYSMIKEHMTKHHIFGKSVNFRCSNNWLHYLSVHIWRCNLLSDGEISLQKLLSPKGLFTLRDCDCKSDTHRELPNL